MIKKLAGIATIVVVILVIAIGITKADTVKAPDDEKERDCVVEKFMKNSPEHPLVADKQYVEKALVLVKPVEKPAVDVSWEVPSVVETKDKLEDWEVVGNKHSDKAAFK